MFNGLVDLPWWGYIAVVLALTHVTIASVTIFLHRHQAHRGLSLHPIISHFFRFWLWLTTGMITKEWVSIHRKHHAKCETEEDPHSPQIVGINKVLWEGAELYRVEARNSETLEKYGLNTPDDWIEHHLYSKYSAAGVAIMLIINFLLFGFIGMTIWAIQMMWIPFFAAGVINGVGHYMGYRNFACEDASTNIIPFGLLIGGEELHNNHHAYASSAKFCNKWYELDIGWVYIRTLETLGLAQVKKVAPRISMDESKTDCDLITLQAVTTHRYDVLAKYAKSLKQTCAEEIAKMKNHAPHLSFPHASTLKRWLHLDAEQIPEADKAELAAVVQSNRVLHTVYSMQQELMGLWKRSSAISQEELLRNLQDWCHRAEASGIKALEKFSKRLRCYT